MGGIEATLIELHGDRVCNCIERSSASFQRLLQFKIQESGIRRVRKGVGGIEREDIYSMLADCYFTINIFGVKMSTKPT